MKRFPLPLLLTLPLLAGCADSKRNRPHLATRALARSVQGADLELLTFSPRSPKGPRPDDSPVLILAAFHGDEPTTADVARRLIAHIQSHPESLAGRTVAIVPVVNPDGLRAGTRVNANQVDVNRNFPAANWTSSLRKTHYYNGPQPASEPETRAVIALLDELKPKRICSIHSIGAGRHQNNYDGPGEPLARAMSERNGYRPSPTIGYPTPGSFGSFAGIDRQIPTITLELPRSQSADKAWADNRDALLAFIRGE